MSLLEFDSYDPTSFTASHTKRFFERWLADPQMRDGLKSDPAAIAQRFKLKIDPQEIRILWDADYRAGRYAQGLTEEEIVPILLSEPEPAKSLTAFIQANHKYRDMMREQSTPADPRFRAWRDRQIARAGTEFRPAYDHNTPHILYAVELSKGCSVGCWFCGVSAEKISERYPHTPENAALFRGVLETLKGFTGVEAGGWGFLYWATDPFDNPDYEKFCLDFYETFARFPVTTTAQPLKNPERTHRFIEFARSHGCKKTRFSILSLNVLTKVHEEFSAEELAYVDLIPLNQGALLQKASTGKARERYLQQAVKENRPPVDSGDQSISCVSGFLLNIIDRTVKLITPCCSDDRWPLGYYVCEEGVFADAEDLRDLVEGMIERHMPLTVPPDKPLRFRKDLGFEPVPDGFQLSTKHGRQLFHHNILFPDLGELIRQGDKTPREISQFFHDEYIIEPAISQDWMETLFRHGVIDEEPRPKEVTANA